MKQMAWLWVLAAGAICASASAQPVDGKEIQDTWVGKEMQGRAPSGARVLMTLQADGTAKLLIAAIPDSGTWRAWEQGYCTVWKGLRAGQETCFTVKRDGDKFAVYRPDGSLSGTLEMK